MSSTSSSSLTTINNLESALESVLHLEEIYHSKISAANNNQKSSTTANSSSSLEAILLGGGSTNTSSFSSSTTTKNSKAYSQIENSRVFGHLVGGASANGGLESLLKGGAGIRNVHRQINDNEQQNSSSISAQQQRNLERAQQEKLEQAASEKRKLEAKHHWRNLDQKLVNLMRMPQEEEEEASFADVKCFTDEKDTQAKKVLSDVVKGRPDRWIRIASVAEREGLRREINQVLEKIEAEKQDDSSRMGTNNTTSLEFLKGQQQQGKSHDVVLGSSASSVSRAILHTLLMN